MKEYKTKEFAAEISCSHFTVRNWRFSRNGQPPRLLPARYEGGKAIYTEEQIPLALALLGKNVSATEDVSVSLFDGSENNIDAPANVDNETRADDDRVIDIALYNTFMLWAEKISNGQHDAVYPFVAKLKETFDFAADKEEIIDVIKTEDLNGARRYLSQFNFVAKDDTGSLLKLVANEVGEYDLIDIPADVTPEKEFEEATAAPATDAAPVVEETDGTEYDDFADAPPVFVPTDDSDDDELIDPPAQIDDANTTEDSDTSLEAVSDAPATDDAPNDDLPVDDAQDEQSTISQPLADDAGNTADNTPAAQGFNLMAHGFENVEAKIPDGSEVADDTAVNVPSPVITAAKDFLPMTITPIFDAIPQAMKDLRRWLCWKLQPADPKPKKVPMTPKKGRLVNAAVNKPENWLTFDEAISYYKRDLCTGIGFALTSKAPKLCCVDIDHCFNPDGSLTDEAQAVIALCGNSFVEKSQSGTGIHIWFFDEEFPGERGRKRGGVEVYAFDRYIAITGVRVETSSKELLTINGACRNVIARFIDAELDKPSLFDKPARSADGKSENVFHFDTNAPLTDDDRRLVEYLRSDKCKDRDPNIFNLFSGNIAEYFKAQGKPLDDSVADCDLLIKLLYYVGGEGSDADIGQRALKVFWQSELAKRGKWQDREDYRLRTLNAAFDVWVKGGRKASKSDTTDTAAQIEELKAALRENAKALDDFNAQRDAALERLKNVEVFDSDTCLADDVIEAAAFAKLCDMQALSEFKRAIKVYGQKHKETVVNANDFRDCVKAKYEELESRLSGLSARATALQAQIKSAEYIAADDDLHSVKIPDNYAISGNGIWLCAGEDMVPVARLPVIIKGKSFDVDAGNYKLILSYKPKHGKWKRLPAQEAATVFDKRNLVGLVNKGLPVTSTTAKLLVDYLDAFIAKNEDSLPLSYIVGRGGWHEFNDSEYFIDPRRPCVFTNADGKQISVEVDSSSQFAKSLRSKGTLAEWKRAYDLAKPSPVARLMVAASVAAPLLRVLGERNFLLYVYAPTRAGKTTALCLGGSAVGSEKVIRSFDSTRNGLNGAAADVCDFPFIVDEKQVADSRLKEQLDNLVYSLANGVGRTKLNKDSTLKDLPMWRTIALMTGETQMLNDNVTGGANTRLLSIAAPKVILPADTCKKIRDIIADNYGHVMPLVVDKINTAGKQKLRDTYQKNVETFMQKCPDVLPEYCRYMAILTLADALLNSALGTADTLTAYDDAIINAAKIFKLIPTAAEIDDSNAEKDLVVGFIAVNQNRFIGEHNANCPPMPAYGKLADNDGYTYITSFALKECCKNADFDFRKLVADLVGIGFFVPNDKIKKGHKKPLKTVQKAIGKLKPDCYRIPNRFLNTDE